MYTAPMLLFQRGQGAYERMCTMNGKQWFNRTFLALLACGAFLAAGCPCVISGNGNEDTAVRMTPFSGRFGYLLEGRYDFTGTLTKEALTDPNWVLEGTLTFPTTGYTVRQPDVRVAESYPEQVTVTITVTPPAPGTIVAQATLPVQVTADIAASNEAKFSIHIVDEGGSTDTGAPEVLLHKEEDDWQFLPDEINPVLLVTCPSGIGSAVVYYQPAGSAPTLSIGLAYGPEQPFPRLEGVDVTGPDGKKWSGLTTSPQPDGLRFTIPETVFEAGNHLFTISWVDMYR